MDFKLNFQIIGFITCNVLQSKARCSALQTDMRSGNLLLLRPCCLDSMLTAHVHCSWRTSSRHMQPIHGVSAMMPASTPWQRAASTNLSTSMHKLPDLRCAIFIPLFFLCHSAADVKCTLPRLSANHKLKTPIAFKEAGSRETMQHIHASSISSSNSAFHC